MRPPAIFSLTRFRLFASVLGLAIATAPVSSAGALDSAAPAPDPNPTFTLAQFAAGKPMRWIAYGDMRFTDPSRTQGTNPRVRGWLAERIAQEKPEVLLLTGDMPYTGAKAADWDEFQSETAGWKAEHIVELPAPGNHEIYGGAEQGIANYLKNFPNLEGHRYYSALLGNVEVISVDCNEPGRVSDPQARWFAAQLDHIPAQVEFLMILDHMPWVADPQTEMLVNVPSKDDLVLRGILEARLSRIKAKIIVFHGHIHNYERFERKGVEYVISGGGGAEPYRILLRGPSDLYRDPGFPVFHYLTLEVANHRLHAVMWKVKDPNAPTLSVEQKDEFTLTAAPAAQTPASKAKPRPKVQ